MSTTIRTGGCRCGAVRYRVEAEPVATRICWCRDCQYLAANGTVNTIVPTAALHVEHGTTTTHASAAASGNTMRRRFCPTCGTALFANSSARPEFTALRVGTLDDPSSVRPSVNIWTRSAPTWACLDATLANEPAQPPAPGAVAPSR